MRLSLFLIGLLLFAPNTRAADPETLYQRIRASVMKEVHTDEAELSVQRFVTGAYYHHVVTSSVADDNGNISDEPFNITEEDIDKSLKKDVEALCGDKHHQLVACNSVQVVIEQLTQRATWVRTMGRELQSIAAGYESGTYGYPGSMVNIAIRLASIGTIWRAGNDPFVQPIVESFVRGIPLPDKPQVESRFNSLIATLEALIKSKGDKKDDTEFVAAVWRYRNGVNYVIQKEGPCQQNQPFPQDPERLYQLRRYCNIESDLLSIHQQILAAAVIDPAKARHEQIIFPSVIDKKKNLMLWIRDDDIGLHWYIPVEPMQAAMFHPDFVDCLEGGSSADTCAATYDSFIVRGGNYPAPLNASGARVPEPKQGEGLCSHPFARRGYLCRNIETEACDLTSDDIDELIDSGSADIQLTACEPERFRDDVARRVSGSDICGIGGWRATVQENLVKDTPEKQPDMRPNKCSACAIDIECADTCNGQTDFALTALGKEHGVVRICIPNPIGTTGALEYLVAHEMIHAMQLCQQSELQSHERAGIVYSGATNEEDRKKGAAGCCSVERESYFVQCKMMAMDGILNIAGVSLDQCASAYANFSCQSFAKKNATGPDKYPCTDDGVDPMKVANTINKVLAKEKGNLNLPTSCPSLINAPTARIQAIYDSIPLTCAPGCQSRYANTIGNNLCYTGQCIEQTYEFQRIIPGRTALTEVDEAYPWDACEFSDPNLGAVADPPALLGPKIPPFRPLAIIQKLDTALCQLNGLPPKTPPVVCNFDPNRRVLLPLMSGLETTQSLTAQPTELAASEFGLREGSYGIGARIVTDLFAQYMKPAAQQFAGLVDMARITLGSLGNVTFPETMCPRVMEGSDVCAPFPKPSSGSLPSPTAP